MVGMADVPGQGDVADFVGAPVGDGFGAELPPGAGVLIGIPGMGAIVGSAAATGAAHMTISAVANERRV
jgi:hypothetical protein